MRPDPKSIPVRSQRRSLVTACIACAVVLAVLLAAAVFLTYREANRIYPLVRAEAGLAHLDPDNFLRDRSERATYDKGISQEQLSTPGVYDVVIRCGNRTYPAKVEVIDTTAPVGVATALTSTGELPAPASFVSSIADATKVTVTYKTTPDMTVTGTQTVTLILTDAAGNTSELTAQLTVTPNP